VSEQCPKCGSSAIVSAGYALRKGGKVHSSKCTNCGHACTDDKLVKTVPEHAFIREPQKPRRPNTETQKSAKMIDKGHKL
jgi:transcription initiation factor TFIIIB Brf1 subunit/transcription initiation factor TFIIB